MVSEGVHVSLIHSQRPFHIAAVPKSVSRRHEQKRVIHGICWKVLDANNPFLPPLHIDRILVLPSGRTRDDLILLVAWVAHLYSRHNPFDSCGLRWSNMGPVIPGTIKRSRRLIASQFSWWQLIPYWIHWHWPGLVSPRELVGDFDNLYKVVVVVVVLNPYVSVARSVINRARDIIFDEDGALFRSKDGAVIVNPDGPRLGPEGELTMVHFHAPLAVHHRLRRPRALVYAHRDGTWHVTVCPPRAVVRLRELA